jgi:hypothetical protein
MNSYFLLKDSCTIHSFFPRTVRDWNLLAPDIVELDTPEAFKATGSCPYSPDSDNCI